MNFCIDDQDNKIVIKGNLAIGNEYNFCGIKPVNEEELFQEFKRKWFHKQSKVRLDIARDMGGMDRYKKRPINVHTGKQSEIKVDIPFTGSYIIPKLFNYFPFLDCDDENTYENAKFTLALEEIPYKAYKSNKNSDSYWIFCDHQVPLEEVIKFIESHPCDHRYPWIARVKKELCVRAVPKFGSKPSVDDDYLVNSYTDDFKYWIDKFDNYWKDGLIPNFINTMETVNNI